MNIVFGGSFNPPTKGHLEIARNLIKRFNPEKFIFLPVGNDYGKPNLVPGHHRLEMLKTILEGPMDVSNYELTHEYKGTYYTLKALELEDVYFVMGYDNFESIKTWNDYEQLLEEFKFILVSRDGSNIDFNLLKEYNENVIIIDDVHLDVSSTKYRETKDSNLIDSRVEKYIKNNSLY